jgi:hypothetical protein
MGNPKFIRTGWTGQDNPGQDIPQFVSFEGSEEGAVLEVSVEGQVNGYDLAGVRAENGVTFCA